MYSKTQNNFFGKNNNKEAAIIVYSARDAKDSAINFKTNKKFYENNGLYILNKNKIAHDMGSESWICDTQLEKFKNTRKIKDGLLQTKVIIHAHGTAGWLLGDGEGIESEHAELLDFARKIREIEKIHSIKIKSVDIKACYSAAEFFNLDSEGNNGVLFSPARHLSFMLPDVLITASIGPFNDVKVGVFDAEKNENTYISNGIVEFKNGKGLFPSEVHKKIYSPPSDAHYNQKMLTEAKIPNENRVFVDAFKECRGYGIDPKEYLSTRLLFNSKEFGLKTKEEDEAISSISKSM